MLSARKLFSFLIGCLGLILIFFQTEMVALQTKQKRLLNTMRELQAQTSKDSPEELAYQVVLLRERIQEALKKAGLIATRKENMQEFLEVLSRYIVRTKEGQEALAVSWDQQTDHVTILFQAHLQSVIACLQELADSKPMPEITILELSAEKVQGSHPEIATVKMIILPMGLVEEEQQ